MAIGAARTPPLANTPYADAISSNMTSEEPSVSEGVGCRLLSMPNRGARATMFSGPTLNSSRTVASLRQFPSANRIVTQPYHLLSKFVDHQLYTSAYHSDTTT